MTIAARNARLAAAVLRHHGEPITTAVGAAVGVVELPSTQPLLRAVGERRGGVELLQHQSEPACLLAEADAAGLHEGEAVTLRGTAYTIIELLPDDVGLTRLRLVPADAAPPTPLPTGAGWR